MEVNDRVALRRGGWEGRVVRAESAGAVHVAFDNGGSGVFPETDLRFVGHEDKSWPPRLEGKDLPRC